MSNKVHIVFVLDRSGSMSSVANDAAGGFNQFVEAQKKAKVKPLITLIQFDTAYEVNCEKVALKDAPVLTVGENYIPRGMTALNDALGKAITTHEDEKHVIVGVMTDGQENSSHEFSKDALKSLIERKQKDGWEFHYLSSDLNAFSDAGQLGILKQNTVNMTNDSAGARSAYATFTSATTKYVSSNS